MRGFDLYKRWINDRDIYLEDLLDSYRIRITADLHEIFANILAAVKSNTNEDLILSIIRAGSQRITTLILELRKSTMEFVDATETEILSRILNKPIQSKPRQVDSMFAGQGPVYDRVFYYLRKLTRKLQNTADMYTSRGEEISIELLLAMLPRLKKIGTTRKVLRKVKEADLGSEGDPFLKDFSTQFLTDADWDRLEISYKKKYIPITRDPSTYFYGGAKRQKEDRVYGWELENDIVYDFVQQVRSGQSQAANDAGIKDFVWISIIDNRTDECCEWRDGLTTSEIEDQLKTKRKDDECQAVTPPAHFNCRCTLAPSGDELPDVPESNRTEFEDWLNS